jgi:diacylglycerol kinase (ATP)
MKVKVIVNPYANRWGAKARLESLREDLIASQLPFDLAVTEGPGDGITIEGYDAIIAAGGDGTINEVINGILRATPDGPTLPFGIIPLGTANDFNLLAGLPPTVLEAIEVIKNGHTRQIDAGQVNDRYFINNSAITMEPTVTLESLKIQRISGEARYLVALLRALVKLKAWRLDARWDGGQFEGPAYLLSVCNSPRTGGFTMAPGAELDDGRLDIVLVPEVPKTTFLQLLLLLLQGKHTQRDEVLFTRMTRLSITSDPGTPVHADGEIFSTSETNFTYSVLPGKVTLLSPPPKS